MYVHYQFISWDNGDILWYILSGQQSKTLKMFFFFFSEHRSNVTARCVKVGSLACNLKPPGFSGLFLHFWQNWRFLQGFSLSGISSWKPVIHVFNRWIIASFMHQVKTLDICCIKLPEYKDLLVLQVSYSAQLFKKRAIWHHVGINALVKSLLRSFKDWTANWKDMNLWWKRSLVAACSTDTVSVLPSLQGTPSF